MLITTYKLGLKLNNNIHSDNEVYLLISNISENGTPYDINIKEEFNHRIFGFPLNHIKDNHLFIIKETQYKNTIEYKITPANPNTYHLIINDKDIKEVLNLFKQRRIESEIINSIENLKSILRDIQLNKLI